MSQPRIFLSPPHQSGRERLYLQECLDANWVAPAGPHLERLERAVAEATGTRGAVAVSSGTAALHLAMIALGVQPDDEVLCSTLTFCASANPIAYERGRPVFVDADESTWNIDPGLVEEELRRCASRGKLPKAVVAVDLFGQSADWDALESICERHGVPLVADAAESLGATYRGAPAGSRGWASIISFNGNKIVTAGGGGALCSNDEELLRMARHRATQARDPAPHYQHSVIGHNYRMSNILAAVGLAQLETLGERVAARRANFDDYRRRLDGVPGISFMPEASYGRANRWLSVIRIDPELFGADREQVRVALERADIESRPVWKPLHLQPVFAGCRSVGGAVSERLFADGLCLPSGSALTAEQRARVVEVLLNQGAAARRRVA